MAPDGLLSGLTKQVLETGLEVEMSDHLGYDRHDPAGRHSGNSRNGTRAKTVLTDVGRVEVEVPRDRAGRRSWSAATFFVVVGALDLHLSPMG